MLREGLERQVGQRRPAPELESLAQLEGAFGGRFGLRGLDQATEASEVELVR